MKKLLLILCVSSLLVSCSHSVNKPVINVEYFKNNDVLLPDYAIADTLIVKDADGLNKDMALIEQGFIDATDKEISTIFYKHCTIK